MDRNQPGWKLDAATLVGILIAAAVIRWLPWRNCFSPDRIYFFGPDPYYHLRRTLMTVADFWHTPQMDYYLGFPHGTVDRVSPLMYLLAGGVSWLVAGGMPGPKAVETVAAVLPTIWGPLCIVPVYLLTRQLAGRSAAIVAAATMAVMPDFVLQTLVGCFDNNGLEPLLAAGFFLTVARLLPSGKDEAPGSTSGRSVSVLLAGFAGWLALFTWRGSIMFFVMAVLFCCAELLIAGYRRRPPCIAFRPVGSMFIVTSLLTLPFVAAGIWGAQPVFRFNIVSWLHLLALAGCGLLFLLLDGIPSDWFAARRSGRVMTGVALAIALVTGFAMALSRGGGELTLYDYLFAKRNPWDVAELQGLFVGEEGWSLAGASRTLTYGFWIFPVFWLVAAGRELRAAVPQPRLRLYLVWSAGFLAAAVIRVRFTPLASLGVAIALGLLFQQLVNAMSARSTEQRRLAARWLAAAAIALLLLPSWLLICGLPRYSFKLPITDDLFTALDWLRDNTPPTSYFDRPERRPEYGVLARWDFGHWINYIARRPAVATPMLSEVYGLQPQARFFLTEKSAEAEQILKDNRVRYVISTNTVQALSSYAVMLGMNAAVFLEEIRDTSGQIVDNVQPGWFRLLSTRLHFNDGLPFSAEDSQLQVPQHLRLVFESSGSLDVRGFTKKVAPVKVFEYVPGATLRGTATPNSPMSAEVTVLTNQGRSFVWKVVATAGPDGSYAMTVPYATRSLEQVRGTSPYRLKTSAGERLVDVDVASVVQGKTVLIPK